MESKLPFLRQLLNGLRMRSTTIHYLAFLLVLVVIYLSSEK